tara:strand:- start:124 stop:714 length:591 start_codon:yes stop_codon:yes gene_type:complete
MSFRIEEKLFIKKEQVSEFKNFIKSKFAKKIYEPRIVNSLYFENSKMEMYDDSIEGLTPRKKIRVRNYPKQDKNNHNLEIKFSSVEGRYKTKKKIEIDEFEKIKKNGIFDSQYGVCFPKLHVSYLREYYLIKDVRITVDTDINYQLYQNSLKTNDPSTIIEIKAGIKKSIDELTENFPIQRIRFSKYCNGIESFKR